MSGDGMASAGRHLLRKSPSEAVEDKREGVWSTDSVMGPHTVGKFLRMVS